MRRLPGLRERAEAGDVHASYAYGKILGDWGGADDRHLVRWIEPAALAGDPQAAYDLAELYGALRRPALRDQWYRTAAEAGHDDACNQMGWLSEHHRDYQEAERWYVRAAGDGSPLNSMLAGKLKAQRGAYAEAEPFLQMAWEQGGDSAYRTAAAGGAVPGNCAVGLLRDRDGTVRPASRPCRGARTCDATPWDPPQHRRAAVGLPGAARQYRRKPG